MKLLPILCTAGLLTGCAISPASNPWEDVAVQAEQASDPPACGPWPLPAAVGSDSVTYDHAGVVELDEWKQCAEANQVVAQERTAEVNEHRVAEANLVEAGKAEHRLSEIRRQALEEERRARLWASVQYWVVIGALALAL